MSLEDGRKRVVIESVYPEIDCGHYAIKRAVGEKVAVEADIFTDGHDAVSAVLMHRKADSQEWRETPMRFLVNDRWRAEFAVSDLGQYEYTLCAWVDHFKSWRRDMEKKVDAGQDVSVDLLIGAQMIADAVERAGSSEDARQLKEWAETLRSRSVPDADKIDLALGETVAQMMERYPDRRFAITYPSVLRVAVDRERARFSSWYEMFPRSASPEPGRHGTFKDVEARLPYVAELGFDVLYLPPIHPIGRTHRKGKNNVITSESDDVGSPWAIGSELGGHKAIEPKLGTLEDFRHLVQKAKEYGIEVALDIAFQCSPDHPYVKERPEWFRWRPDGTVQYAENPPKKYQDIYPFEFETEHWKGLWEELKSIFDYWIEQGVRIFRVDNPHTKPFGFWEWAIAEIKERHPDVILLSEAFTRPKVMYRLAKLGFTQSYTYFAWRNTKRDLTQYITELTQTEVKEFFRPNFWPNTPDILNEYLQIGGRPAFMTRLVLAATMTANYGIYGPAFELMENKPREPGSEEYLDSEKYEVRHWDLKRSDSLKDFIARVNRIRKGNPALQSNDNFWTHAMDNDQLICYSKRTDDRSNVMLMVVNLDPNNTQSGWVTLDMEELGLKPDEPFQVHDLLGDGRYLWHGPRNFVQLNPWVVPAHIFRVRRRVRTERDFDYFM